MRRPAAPGQAIVAHSMVGGDLPPGRRNFADNLHLGGAHQDNRIIPYEGVRGSALAAVHRRQLLDLIALYVAPLPAGPQAAHMEEIERHLDDTHSAGSAAARRRAPSITGSRVRSCSSSSTTTPGYS